VVIQGGWNTTDCEQFSSILLMLISILKRLSNGAALSHFLTNHLYLEVTNAHYQPYSFAYIGALCCLK